MFCEVKIKVSNEEQKNISDFTVEKEEIPLVIDRSCERLAGMVQTAIDKFKGDVDDVRCVVTFYW